MRLSLDEDLSSKELRSRLTEAGHEVLPLRSGEADSEVWRRAQAEEAAVLTMNAVDFEPLAVAADAHHGLLLVYRANDPTRDMTAAAIAAAVARVSETYGDSLKGMILVLNQFRW